MCGVYGLVLSLRRERLLLLADTHVGYEVELRRVKGVNAMSQTRKLVERVLELADLHNVTTVAILGDVKHELPVPRESVDEVRTFLTYCGEEGASAPHPGQPRLTSSRRSPAE
jgi:metallophosphoesterase superfamily enzyme